MATPGSFCTSGAFNYGHWSNPAADGAIDQACAASGPEERRALYAKLWAAERDDMPLVYLYIAKNIVGLRRSLTGFVQVPGGLIRLRGLRFN